MNVTVTVTIVTNLPDTLTIKVAPEPVHLSALGPGDEIIWEVEPDGWTFAKNAGGESTGIEIKAPAGVFKNKGGAHAQKRHKHERTRKDNKTYRYMINVTNGTTTLSWDPTIMND